MSDAPKSAWEIALEKLQQQDRDRGVTGPGALSEDQKKEIAAVRQRCQAKLAEAEILHGDQRRKVLEDPEALAKAEEEYRIERRRIEEQRDREIERVRRGDKAPAAKKTAARAAEPGAKGKAEAKAKAGPKVKKRR
ncbi:MAG TPA: hypothetical protein VFQ07_10605 [Candidatus Polarisedimenticolia bacterium]|nr:hypothetical protein [Candidatus Polarisedimenticolia bacterium]